MFAKGNMQTEIARPDVRPPRLSDFPAPASALTLAANFRQPALSSFPSHALRSAHWIWLNGIGGMLPSSVA